MFDKESARITVGLLLNKYKKIQEEGKVSGYNEEQTKMEFIIPLFRALGWDIENEVSFEDKISKGRVDFSFKINGVPKFLLEAKKLSENLKHTDFAEQAIGYAFYKAVTWAVLTNFETLIIFNAEWKPKNTIFENRFKELKWNEFLDRFEELWLLSKESIISGQLDKEAEKGGKKIPKDPIDKQLLNELTHLRELLSNDIVKMNPESPERKLSRDDIDESVQRMIDRLIFIRKFEDQGIEPNILQQILRNWRDTQKRPLMERLVKDIFYIFNEHYDGKLFEEHLCDKLKISNQTLEKVIDNLYRSKDGSIFYDFSLIDADVLGNIYEQYLGNILKKTPKRAKLEPGKAHRKEQGIYYTPTYIVDYIVKNTIGELAKDKNFDMSKIRVLDPACGSGSFLIKAFDYLFSNGDTSYERKLQILKNNIFGVDLDSKAVEIAQLNLLLKVAESKKRLPFLQNSIKCGNSLIDDPKFSPRSFKWEDEFSEIMKEGGFDVVIGNPPYLLMQPQNIPNEILTYLKNKFHVAQYKMDTYHLFLEKAISLLKDGGYLGFITPNTFLKNKFTKKLREWIFRNCAVKKVIIIPQNVFPEASVDTCVIILQKSKSSEKNTIEIVQINDFRKEINLQNVINVPQRKIMESENLILDISLDESRYPWISKFDTGLKLGDIADAYFGIQTFDRNKFVKSIKENDEWKPTIDGGNIQRYLLLPPREFVLFSKKAIKSGGDQRVYENDRIVTRQIGKYPIYCLIPGGIYTLNTVYNITLKDKKFDIRFILGLLNSKAVCAYWITKFFDYKKTFPKIKKKPLLSLPIPKAPPDKEKLLIELVDELLLLNEKLNKLGEKKTDERTRIEEELQKTDAEIDKLVYELYGLTPEEIKIVEESLKA